jgi:hypothetical protein
MAMTQISAADKGWMGAACQHDFHKREPIESDQITEVRKRAILRRVRKCTRCRRQCSPVVLRQSGSAVVPRLPIPFAELVVRPLLLFAPPNGTPLIVKKMFGDFSKSRQKCWEARESSTVAPHFPTRPARSAVDGERRVGEVLHVEEVQPPPERLGLVIILDGPNSMQVWPRDSTKHGKREVRMMARWQRIEH